MRFRILNPEKKGSGAFKKRGENYGTIESRNTKNRSGLCSEIGAPDNRILRALPVITWPNYVQDALRSDIFD